MTLQGYQFDKAKVTPESDAQLYSYLARSSDNKVISGMTATTTGLNVYVASGKALVQGRLVEVTQQHQLTAQANKTGYVCITIDLTQDNASTGTPGTSNYVPVNNQLRLELVETLVQQDLSNGGLIYTLPIYSYTATGTSITLKKNQSNYNDLSQKRAEYYSAKSNTITLTAPFDCVAEIDFSFYAWGYGGAEWEVGLTTPAGTTQLYEATGYTNGHNAQGAFMPVKSAYAGLIAGNSYTFTIRDIGGRAGGWLKPTIIAKLNRI